MATESPDRADDWSAAADRLDELGEAAELMGDADGAIRLRERALSARMEAMKRLDAASHNHM